MKDLLWDSCSSLNCLDEYIDRRESINKPKVHALCEDIYKAIGQIQDQERTVSFYAADWSIVPKVKPESITDVSTAEKLSLLEAKFDIMCNRVSSLEGDTKTHSALIHEVSQKLASCNTAAVEDDQPGEDQSDPLADPEVPDNANHQQPQPTGGDEAQEDGSEIPASNNSLNINAAEGSEAEDPFLRPTHEVRRERKIARAKERTSYSKWLPVTLITRKIVGTILR